MSRCRHRGECRTAESYRVPIAYRAIGGHWRVPRVVAPVEILGSALSQRLTIATSDDNLSIGKLLQFSECPHVIDMGLSANDDFDVVQLVTECSEVLRLGREQWIGEWLIRSL